jgi:hypothetical protein
VNLKVVSDLLGHTDIASTARYARGDERALGNVADVLDKVNDAMSEEGAQPEPSNAAAGSGAADRDPRKLQES